jgi:hypothetical protein
MLIAVGMVTNEQLCRAYYIALRRRCMVPRYVPAINLQAQAKIRRTS